MNKIFIFLALISFSAFALADAIDDIDNEIDADDIVVPEVIVPSVEAPEIDTPEIYTYYINTFNVRSYGVYASTVNCPEIYVPTIVCVDVDQEISFAMTLPVIHTVNGNVIYTSNKIAYYSMLCQWNDIFKQNEDISFISTGSFSKTRVISEARVSSERNISTFEENLMFYKKKGYSAVLLTFDDNSSIEDGLEMIEAIEWNDMKIWLAYAGSHNPFNPLMDPMKYRNLISAFAPYCEAFMISWRDTSIHYADLPKGFKNYSVKIAREANQGIKIIGEVYRGKSAYSPYATTEDTTRVSGESALLSVNFDKSNVSRKYAVRHLLNLNNNIQIVAVVCGDPGYFSKQILSYEENFRMKKTLENEFFKYGCSCTITIPYDGTDDGYDNGIGDIARTSYRMMKSN